MASAYCNFCKGQIILKDHVILFLVSMMTANKLQLQKTCLHVALEGCFNANSLTFLEKIEIYGELNL